MLSSCVDKALLIPLQVPVKTGARDTVIIGIRDMATTDTAIKAMGATGATTTQATTTIMAMETIAVSAKLLGCAVFL